MNLMKHYSACFLAAASAFTIGMTVVSPTPFQIGVAAFSIMAFYSFIHSFDNK